MNSSLTSIPHHLLFDLDGTLSDPRHGIFSCFHRALTVMGKKIPSHDELTACIGPPLEDCFSRLLPSADTEEIAQAVHNFRYCYGHGGLIKNILYPHVTELLQNLHTSGLDLFVVTAKKEEFAKQILRYFKIDIFFKDIVGASRTQTGDKGGLIAEIIGRHALPTTATIMIGDRGLDIIGAKANGINSYGVLWGFGNRQELEDAGATKIFSNKIPGKRPAL